MAKIPPRSAAGPKAQPPPAPPAAPPAPLPEKAQGAPAGGEALAAELRAAGRALADLAPPLANAVTMAARLLSPSAAPGPTSAEVDAYNISELGRVAGFRRILYDRLPQAAREGVYILLARGVAAANIERVLTNPAISEAGGVDHVFAMVAALYDHGVTGFEHAFRASDIDERLLSREGHRTHSMMQEMEAALELAANAGARVEMGKELGLGEGNVVEVDALAELPDGRRILVEVKSSLGELNPGDVGREQMLAQLDRHAKLVRRHNLAGIDYAIRASKVNGEFLAALYKKLRATRVPFVIRHHGGEGVQSVPGGLDYDMRPGVVGLARTRVELPPIPRTEGAAALPEAAEEIVEEERPWTKGMKKWLDRILPREINVRKYKKPGDFVRATQDELRARNAAEVKRKIVAWLATEDGAPHRAEMRPILARFDVGSEDYIGREKLGLLVDMAAIATGAEVAEEPVAPIVRGEDDASQALATMRASGEAMLGSTLEEWEGILATADAVLDQSAGRREYTEAAGLMGLILETEVARIGGRGVALPELVLILREANGGTGWDSVLVERAERLVVGARQMQRRVEEVLSRLPLEAPRPLTQIYEPIPEDELERLREHVRDMGELPIGRRVPRGRSRAAPRQEAYGPERLDAIYRGLTLYHPEGDERASYYYPEDLRLAENRARAYLAACGITDGARIASELEAAFGRFAGTAVGVRSLHDIIPDKFKRSDLIAPRSRFTGDALDATQLAARLWREERARAGDHIRVVVMESGRKVYFVDWEGLQGAGLDARFPTFEELKGIMGDEVALRALIEVLSEDGRVPEGKFALVGLPGANDSISGLRTATVEETHGLGYSYFVLQFEPRSEGLRFRPADGEDQTKGWGALDLALAFLEGKLDSEVTDPAERAIAAEWLGAKQLAAKGEMSLNLGDVAQFIVRNDAWSRLSRMYESLFGRQLQEKSALVGRLEPNGSVNGLRIVTVEKARRFLDCYDYFVLRVERRDEGLGFMPAEGNNRTGGPGALDLALAFLEARHGLKVTDPVELAIVASGLGTQQKAAKGNVSLKLEDVARFITRSDSAKRFRSIYEALFGRWFLAKFALVGKPESDGSVVGLRVATVEEVRGLSRRHFILQLEPRGDGLGFRPADEENQTRGTAALDLALAFLKVRSALDVIDPAERAIVADWLGTKQQVAAGEESLKSEAVARLIARGDSAVRLRIIHEVLFGFQFPARFVLIGQLESNGTIVGLRIVTSERAHNLSGNVFVLQLESRGEDIGFRLVEGEDQTRGPGALDQALMFLKWKLGAEVNDPVEQAIIAAWLGARRRTAEGEVSLTFENVARFIAEGDAWSKLHLMYEALFGRQLPANAALVGWPKSSNDTVTGLRIVTVEEARRMHRNCFAFEFREGPGVVEWIPVNDNYLTRRLQGMVAAARAAAPALPPNPEVEDAPRPKEAQGAEKSVPSSGGRPSGIGTKLFSGEPLGIALQMGYDSLEAWADSTRGYSIPATPENLARFGLAEPATIAGRAIRYIPGEGAIGIASAFMAPLITERVLGIDIHRAPGAAHIVNLGVLHLLNSLGGAAFDVAHQVRMDKSAARMGGWLRVSPSLARTLINGTDARLAGVGGLASGLIWAYPGSVAASWAAEQVTDNQVVQAVAGGVGFVALPGGLYVALGEKGMQRIAASAAGAAISSVGAAILIGDAMMDFDEQFRRHRLTDDAIAKREVAIQQIPWYERWLDKALLIFSMAADPSPSVVDIMTGNADGPRFSPDFVLEGRNNRTEGLMQVP